MSVARDRWIAHFGIRVRDFAATLRWWQVALQARVQFENEFVAFLTFDDDHHRLVIWSDAETTQRPPDAAGVDHICFELSSFGALADEYERLSREGIVPTLPVNHRFTTSLYYRDPEGNELELSVDNFATKAEGTAWVCGDAMAAILVPPFGDPFDPEELVRLVREGASREELAKLGRRDVPA